MLEKKCMPSKICQGCVFYKLCGLNSERLVAHKNVSQTQAQSIELHDYKYNTNSISFVARMSYILLWSDLLRL